MSAVSELITALAGLVFIIGVVIIIVIIFAGLMADDIAKIIREIKRKN